MTLHHNFHRLTILLKFIRLVYTLSLCDNVLILRILCLIWKHTLWWIILSERFIEWLYFWWLNVLQWIVLVDWGLRNCRINENRFYELVCIFGFFSVHISDLFALFKCTFHFCYWCLIDSFVVRWTLEKSFYLKVETFLPNSSFRSVPFW